MEPIGSDGLSPEVEKLIGGATIRFEITNAFLSLNSNEPERKQICFHVRPAAGERIKLTTEDQLSDLKGVVGLYSDAGDSPEKRQERKNVEVLGALLFTESGEQWPAIYTIELTLPEAQFDMLYEAAKVGRIPSDLSVTLKRWGDLKLDWNDTYTWDNKASQGLVLKSAKFTLPLVTPSDVQGEERNPLANALPATRLQIDQLAQRLENNKNEIVKILTRILWAVVVVGGVTVLARFH
jgi:hypothetical protein